MKSQNDLLQKSKISAPFKARLLNLPPQQKVRAIVLLRTDDTNPPSVAPKGAPVASGQP